MKNTRPFKGASQKRVFQTVDIGSGKAEWLIKQKQRFGDRRYLAVDPEYRQNQELMRRLKAHGLETFAGRMQGLIRKLKETKQKTRHINIDMPSYSIEKNAMNFIMGGKKHWAIKDEYGFHILFKELPKILLPNGKVFVTSENSSMLDLIEEIAHDHGFPSRRLRGFDGPIQAKRTAFMKAHQGQTIHSIEISFGLKKALPNKAQRKNWVKE